MLPSALSVEMWLLDVLSTVFAAVGATVLVRCCEALHTRGIVNEELSRKLVHISAGLAFLLSWSLYSPNHGARWLAAVVPAANAVRLLAAGCGHVEDPHLLHSVTRSGHHSELLQGPLAYVAVLLAATVLAWRHHPSGILAVAMMCGGDGLAEVLGRRWGQRLPLPWNRNKTWAGCAGFLLGGLCSAYGLLAYFMHEGFLSSLQATPSGPTESTALLQRIVAISAACAIVESLPTPTWLNDNLTVPATAAALGAALLPGTWPEAPRLIAVLHANGARPGLLVGAAVNTAVFAVGMRLLRKGLSPSGVMHAWVLGTVVYGVFGAGGYALVCLFFVIGTLVTRVKLQQKQSDGVAEANRGRRGPGSVWGSGAAAVMCAALAVLTGQAAFWQVGFAASLASKLADTVSSEIGKAYGTTTYRLTTWQRVPRGTEGAVSLEGSLAGLTAAASFALCSTSLLQDPIPGMAVLVTAAAVAANLMESFLGETLQGRAVWINNDALNIIQTCTAAAAAVAGHYIMVSLQARGPWWSETTPDIWQMYTAAAQWYCTVASEVV